MKIDNFEVILNEKNLKLGLSVNTDEYPLLLNYENINLEYKEDHKNKCIYFYDSEKTVQFNFYCEDSETLVYAKNVQEILLILGKINQEDQSEIQVVKKVARNNL